MRLLATSQVLLAPFVNEQDGLFEVVALHHAYAETLALAESLAATVVADSAGTTASNGLKQHQLQEQATALYRKAHHGLVRVLRDLMPSCRRSDAKIQQLQRGGSLNGSLNNSNSSNSYSYPSGYSNINGSNINGNNISNSNGSSNGNSNGNSISNSNGNSISKSGALSPSYHEQLQRHRRAQALANVAAGDTDRDPDGEAEVEVGSEAKGAAVEEDAVSVDGELARLVAGWEEEEQRLLQQG